MELVIGALIQCDQKEIYINEILQLEEQYQTQLMHLIKKILDKNKLKESHDPRDFEKEKKLLIKLDEVENENAILISRLQETSEENEKQKIKINELFQQCIELEQQVKNYSIKQEFLSAVQEKSLNYSFFFTFFFIRRELKTRKI